MIPENLYTISEIEEVRQPSRTYRLDTEKKRIMGRCDGLAALEQAIYKTLATERYAWLIYSWDYGASLEPYIGKDFDYIKADAQREIREALLVDDRIKSVDGFRFEQAGIDSMAISFTVSTDLGPLDIQTEIKQ